MHAIEYRHWAPAESPLSVEFPAERLLQLGSAEVSGILYGWRRESLVHVTSFTREDEEQENVGVFFSRIRGEVFLTEADLQFMQQQGADLALVVAGCRAGFFVREADGSIQTVRSHEEFSTLPDAGPGEPQPAASRSRPPWMKVWERMPNGAIAIAALPVMTLGALAVFPQRSAPTSLRVEVREAEHQVRITWQPARNAVLTIHDNGASIAIPVTADQTSATYAMKGPEVEVSLLSIDDKNRVQRVTTQVALEKSAQPEKGPQ